MEMFILGNHIHSGGKKMINKEQLNSINFISDDGTYYYDKGTFDYQYNIKNQELWYYNDGYGDEEFMCRVTDIEELKNLINYSDYEFN